VIPDRPLRVLVAYRDDVDLHGGAANVMHATIDALRAQGAEVELTLEVEPRVDGFDVVHPINIWSPSSALAQLRHLHGTGVPIAWQPFYLHWSEYAWANLAIHAAGDPSRPAGERAALLEGIRTGTLEVNGLSRWRLNEPFPGAHGVIAEMASLADHLCVCSTREVQLLAQTTGVQNVPFTVTRHGVHAATYAGADPAPFRALVGDEPFVLCVGSIDTRKNQPLLAHALAGTGIRLVLVGPCYEPATLRLVEELGDENVVRFERLPREMVASAMRAASAHVLPSFAEGSALASMEAAAAGCPVVVSNRSSEFEYYGDLALYCDPLDPASIRAAVERAIVLREEQPERLEALSAHIATFTWDACATATLAAYRRAIAAGRRRARAAAGLHDVGRTVVLASAAELLAEPALLERYGRRATGEDATLVIALDDAGAAAPLGEAVAAAGLDGDGSPDLLAVPDSPLLARAADARLTDLAA
jgi:glycosyltransferase involved in cell wall biosynthesis